jgi:hypothetical protein
VHRIFATGNPLKTQALPAVADFVIYAPLEDSVLALTMRLYIIAARCPPRSEPANNHAFLPRAIPLRARSAALLAKQIRPSCSNRVNAGQRLSM